jgi:ABC-type nitrate/sulfonate/bicarbonate transport system permease component
MIQSSRPVPPVAVMPFCILWFGFAIAGKVLFIALGVFLVVVIGVTDAIDQLNPTYLRVAASFGASNRRYLLYAALPGIGPSLLAPLRIAMSLAVSLAVISEYMGATQGLGYIINNAQTNFSTNTILLCTMLLGAIGSLLDLVVVQCHALVTSWAKTA